MIYSPPHHITDFLGEANIAAGNLLNESATCNHAHDDYDDDDAYDHSYDVANDDACDDACDDSYDDDDDDDDDDVMMMIMMTITETMVMMLHGVMGSRHWGDMGSWLSLPWSLFFAFMH